MVRWEAQTTLHVSRCDTSAPSSMLRCSSRAVRETHPPTPCQGLLRARFHKALVRHLRRASGPMDPISQYSMYSEGNQGQRLSVSPSASAHRGTDVVMSLRRKFEMCVGRSCCGGTPTNKVERSVMCLRTRYSVLRTRRGEPRVSAKFAALPFAVLDKNAVNKSRGGG